MTPSFQETCKTIETDAFSCTDDTASFIDSPTPVVLRGYCCSWPIVKHALNSINDLGQYLLQFDQGQVFEAIIAAPEVKGQLHYRSDMKGFSFERMNGLFSEALRILQAFANEPQPPTFYLGAKEIATHLPGLEREVEITNLNGIVAPNIWIGNQLTIATHNDKPRNIACVAAGKRRFTLFHPNERDNLYIGPEYPTPNGRPISLAKLHERDFSKFPKLKGALKRAHIVELNTGDALFIPSHWWHNVDSLSNFNVLVNYWLE